MTGRRKLLLTVGCLLTVNFFISWILWQAATLQDFEIKKWLASWTVISQSFGWIVLIAAAAVSRQALQTVWSALTKGMRRTVLVLMLSSLAAVLLLPPRTNRIYFDEHIYENIAQGIAVAGEAWMCNEGEAEFNSYRPFAKEYNKQPNGHPFYLSIFYRLFGVSESSAHLANNFALLLGTAAVFFGAFLLFSSEIAAMFAGLLYLLTPMNLIWSATVAVEPAAAAFSALAIAAAALYARQPAIGTAALWGSAVGLAAYFRPESICLVVPALAIVLLFRWRELLEPRFYFGLMLITVLIGVELLHLYVVRNEGWGTTGERFSWAAFQSNVQVNGPYLYLNLRYPVFFTFLALIGVLSISLWRGLSAVLIWFVYSFGIFLFFYAGSFDYGADVRFSMISAAPLSILGGAGAASLAALIRRWQPRLMGSLSAVPLLAGAVLLAWIPFLPLIRSTGTEAADARVDIDAIRAFAAELPAESIVLSHTPTVWFMVGRNSSQTSTATYNRAHIDNDYFKRYGGGVYFHWGAWCNYDNPVQQGFCTKILETYQTRVVDERRFGDKRFVLYQLSLKPNTTEAQPPATPQLAGPDEHKGK